jgi:hypothetical protein
VQGPWCVGAGAGPCGACGPAAARGQPARRALTRAIPCVSNLPQRQVAEKQAQLAALGEERARLHRRAAVVRAAVRHCGALADLARLLRAGEPASSSSGGGGAASDRAAAAAASSSRQPGGGGAAGSEDEGVGRLLGRLGVSEDGAAAGQKAAASGTAGAAPKPDAADGAAGDKQQRGVARQWQAALERAAAELAAAGGGGAAAEAASGGEAFDKDLLWDGAAGGGGGGGGGGEDERGGDSGGVALAVRWWPAGSPWARQRHETLGELQAAVKDIQHRFGCLLP